ncbi:MAG: hypothetical protein ACTH1Z_11595 [Ancrocorticia sp.]|uniref:hypothetical protein n=1 Tax=Ancrocorticia sp. TaxID=2593684 RepID=UPI003F935E11
MNNDKEKCAASALGENGDRWGLTVEDLLAVENGHHFHRGWHIGWAWSTDAESEYVDILSEHRMPGMYAIRVFPDGSHEDLDTPGMYRVVGNTPDEDERLDREFLESNTRAYASLRDRGLLPAFGENIGSQDMNEYLRSGTGHRE